MARNEERDYSRANQAVLDRKERQMQNTLQKAEASEEALTKLFKTALRNERTRQNLAEDCLEGWQGKKRGFIDGEVERGGNPGQLRRGKHEPSIPAGEQDPSITGMDERYWEDDD